MRRFANLCLRKIELWCYRRKIQRALALHLRGEVRIDGLAADHISCRLDIRWRARDIHPWDRQCPQCEREALFAEQALADIEAAIHGLFERLPYVDVGDLTVVEPASEKLIANGTVDPIDPE